MEGLSKGGYSEGSMGRKGEKVRKGRKKINEGEFCGKDEIKKRTPVRIDQLRIQGSQLHFLTTRGPNAKSITPNSFTITFRPFLEIANACFCPVFTKQHKPFRGYEERKHSYQ